MRANSIRAACALVQADGGPKAVGANRPVIRLGGVAASPSANPVGVDDEEVGDGDRSRCEGSFTGSPRRRGRIRVGRPKGRQGDGEPANLESWRRRQLEPTADHQARGNRRRQQFRDRAGEAHRDRWLGTTPGGWRRLARGACGDEAERPSARPGRAGGGLLGLPRAGLYEAPGSGRGRLHRPLEGGPAGAGPAPRGR